METKNTIDDTSDKKPESTRKKSEPDTKKTKYHKTRIKCEIIEELCIIHVI